MAEETTTAAAAAGVAPEESLRERESGAPSPRPRGEEEEDDEEEEEMEEGEIESDAMDGGGAGMGMMGAAATHGHPLEHAWTFWFDNPSGKSKQAAWGSSLRPIHTFSAVEDFWGSEGMATPEEQPTIADNPSRSDKRVDTQLVEEDNNSPTSTPAEDAFRTQIIEERSSSTPYTPTNLKVEYRTIILGESSSTPDSSREVSHDDRESMICKFEPPWKILQPMFVRFGNISTPRVVAIGPLHRDKSLPINDDNKRAIVNWMNEMHSLNSASCISKMENEVEDARDCYYSQDIPQSFHSEDDKIFAEMLLLDSYFILFMLTTKIIKKPTRYSLEPIPNSAKKLQLFRDDTTKFLNIISDKDEIAPDLLMLDNQILFLVIEKLFEELKLEEPLHKYALDFFKTIQPESYRDRIDQNCHPKFLHLLGLFHWSRVPENKYNTDPSSPEMTCHIPSAMELRESATIFENKMINSSLEITFRKCRFIPIIRVLNIPELHIRSYSNLIVGNLIAFEHQYSSKGSCTIAFVALMRNLLRSKEDVKLLKQQGILVSSSMTKSELLNLFECLNSLIEEEDMPSHLSIIGHEVQSYYNSVVSRFFRVVILPYFSSSLLIFSVFVAFLALVPSVVQTIYSILSYIHR